MATYFYVANDHRIDKTTIPSLAGALDGRYLYYDSTLDTLSDVSAVVDLDTDTIITISIYNNIKTDSTESIPSYEADPSISIPGTPEVNIEEVNVIGDNWHEVYDTFSMKRNRALMELFHCTSKFTTQEPIGYNTIIRLSSIENYSLYVSDPLLYDATTTGITSFYFSPQAKSGWFKCFLDNYAELLSVVNPNYDSSKSTALAPCTTADDGYWRTVLNAEYEGMEFDFYINGCGNNWWNLIEGIGHNIKLRLIGNDDKPLPYSAWYPSMSLKSGLGKYSSIGSTVSVKKIEARYVEPRDIRPKV